MVNRANFFLLLKAPLFNGAYLQSQVDNVSAILNEYERRNWTDLRWLAYILATVYHETGTVKNGKIVRTMAAVEEMGKGAGRKYGSNVKYSGKTYLFPDHLYYGRGHTQNTWFETYEKLTAQAKKEGKPWDFLNRPELLLEKEPSIWATFTAMSLGLYTGVKLSRYFNIKATNWEGARAIINGNDKATLIAGYAIIFYDALHKSFSSE